MYLTFHLDHFGRLKINGILHQLCVLYTMCFVVFTIYSEKKTSWLPASGTGKVWKVLSFNIIILRKIFFAEKYSQQINKMPSSNRDIVQELQVILLQWEEDQSVASKDPTPHLIKLCELFERETINFLKKVRHNKHIYCNSAERRWYNLDII